MKILDETVFERTAERVLASAAGPDADSIDAVELWLFEDAERRGEIRRNFAARGIEAKVRSAYKPLVHYFLEEADLAGLARITVRYPVPSGCERNRFLLEAYPLGALLDGVELTFEEGDGDGFAYRVELAYADGRIEAREVFAPNRRYVDHAGQAVVAPTGWLVLTSKDGTVREERLETEYEAIYRTVMETAARHPWPRKEPFFDRLSLSVTLPAEDLPLSLGEEALSLREALHEDLYFSLLEYFQMRTGRPLGDRLIRPGQIVPEIAFGDRATLRIETRPFAVVDPAEDTRDLETAEAPPSPAQIRAELESVEGTPFSATSVAGRTIFAKYRAGSDAPVMISGGQHANETTGIVGALRAARELSRRPNAHFTVAPLENPDGYALHRELRKENPSHMLHAARYTALGNDLEYQAEEAEYEKAIRTKALALSGARLHVNLHGYPSHEWTRPLSGYIPRGFASWMLPHGFFLVLRHHGGWEDKVEAFLDIVTGRLASVPGLLELNRTQIELQALHSGGASFRLVNGFPCLVSVDSATDIPLRLITEFPDETIYGDAFFAGHAAQAATVLAAYDAFQTIESTPQRRVP